MAESRYEYEITADVAQFRRAMDEASRDARNSSREIKDAFSGAGDALASIGRVGGGVFAFTQIVQSVGQFGRAVVASTLEAERSTALLNATLRSTGYAAGLSRADIEKLVGDLSKLSGFDDDPIREGVTSLLRFREVAGDSFREAAKAAVDLAAATGTDVPTAFQKVGKALQDPEAGMKGLREVGVRLSEGQQELAKKLRESGDAAGSQKIVLDELTRSVGGSGATAGSGLSGAAREAANAWDDLLKNIGQTRIVADNARSSLSALALAANMGSRLLTPPPSGLPGTLNVPGVAKSFGIGQLSEAEALALQNAVGPKIKIGEPKATDKEALKEAERIAKLMAEGTQRQAERGANIVFAQFGEIQKAREEAGRELEKALQEGPELAVKQAEELKQKLDSILAETRGGQSSEIAKQFDLIAGALERGKISTVQYAEAYDLLREKEDELFAGKPEENFDRLAQAGKESMRELVDAVKGFSRQASNEFAQMVVDGEADFARLGKSFARMVLAQQLDANVFGPLSKSIGAGLGNLFSGGAGASTATSNPANFGPQLAQYYGYRAEGGDVFGRMSGGWFTVGERGPERLYVPPGGSGTVVPNGAGGVHLTQYIDSRTDLASIAAINARTVRQIEDINAMRARR